MLLPKNNICIIARIVLPVNTESHENGAGQDAFFSAAALPLRADTHPVYASTRYMTGVIDGKRRRPQNDLVLHREDFD